MTNALVFFSESVLNLSVLFFSFFCGGYLPGKVDLQTSSLVAVIFPNTSGAA